MLNIVNTPEQPKFTDEYLRGLSRTIRDRGEQELQEELALFLAVSKPLAEAVGSEVASYEDTARLLLIMQEVASLAEEILMLRNAGKLRVEEAAGLGSGGFGPEH